MKNKIILLFLALCLFACSKENETDDEINRNTEQEIPANETQEPENKIEYYVKYHFYANGYQHYCGFDIVYVNKETPNSNPAVSTISYQYPYVQSKVIDKELICGPFEYGDKLSIKMIKENSVVTRLLEIYVSKNNSPFALRKSTDSKSLEYMIDY